MEAQRENSWQRE
ncbi:hypothetical protein YPPY101_0794, partial [Yersinia pestis PY-101]